MVIKGDGGAKPLGTPPKAPPKSQESPPTSHPPQGGSPLPPPSDQTQTPPEMNMPDGWTDPMSDIDDLAKPAKKGKAKPEPPPPPADEEKEEVEAAPPADEKPEGETEDTPPGTDDIPPSSNFLTAKPLREAYDRNKNELLQARKRIAELETRAKTPEVEQWEAERGVLLDRVKKAEEAATTYERQVALFDYENSREFKEKYLAPLAQAWDSAYAELAELKVSGPEGERPATKEDFQRIVALPLQDAARAASKWFGPEIAPHVMNLRNQVKSAARSKELAITNSRTNSEAVLKERQALMLQEQSENTQLWQDANTRIVTKYPHYFAPREDDPEHNALLEKGYREWDLSVNPQAQVNKQQRFHLMAAQRHKAAAFAAVAKANEALQKKVVELEDIIEELRSGDPGSGGSDTGGGGGGKGPTTWQEDFDKTFNQ